MIIKTPLIFARVHCYEGDDPLIESPVVTVPAVGDYMRIDGKHYLVTRRTWETADQFHFPRHYDHASYYDPADLSCVSICVDPPSKPKDLEAVHSALFSIMAIEDEWDLIPPDERRAAIKEALDSYERARPDDA